MEMLFMTTMMMVMMMFNLVIVMMKVMILKGKKESMMRRTLYCHFDIAAFLAAPCGRLKNYIAFFSQAT